MHNVFVSRAHDLELAGLAVGDFGAAQEGFETVSREQHKAGACILFCHGAPRETLFYTSILKTPAMYV